MRGRGQAFPAHSPPRQASHLSLSMQWSKLSVTSISQPCRWRFTRAAPSTWGRGAGVKITPFPTGRGGPASCCEPPPASTSTNLDFTQGDALLPANPNCPLTPSLHPCR